MKITKFCNLHETPMVHRQIVKQGLCCHQNHEGEEQRLYTKSKYRPTKKRRCDLYEKNPSRYVLPTGTQSNEVLPAFLLLSTLLFSLTSLLRDSRAERIQALVSVYDTRAKLVLLPAHPQQASCLSRHWLWHIQSPQHPRV